MTPEQLARPNSEEAHQTALFCWAAMNIKLYPELKWLHHIPNGGSRGDTQQSRAIAGGKMKAQGVKKGIPDIFLPVGRGSWPGLYIEMKKPAERPLNEGDRGGLSDEQIEFRDFARAQNYGWMVCYTWEEAARAIVWFLTWKL